MASESIESPANNPGLNANPDKETRGYYIQQTMLRIKDPKASLDFYSRVLGMMLLKRLDIPEYKLSVYLMGYEDLALAPNDPIQRLAWALRQKATIELAHFWGTESDPDFKGYHDGNSDPLGYGHIGIAVNDMCKTVARFDCLGVEFVRRPDDGRARGVGFIKDPDGYWVEIIDVDKVAESMDNHS